MPPPLPDDANARGGLPRAFWFGLCLWILICLAAIVIRGVRWEEGYERAQVLLGITPYPDGHPHHRWVWNGFSLHYYLTGAVLWLTRSAAVVSGGRQFLATLAIHLPVYILTWQLARRALPAHVATLLSFAGANTVFQSYMPVSPWANKATSGLIGMGWALTVLIALAAGRWRTAGLLFGLMPLVHLGQWPLVILTVAALLLWHGARGGREACRHFVIWAAAGLACCAVFAVAQQAVRVPVPESGAYHAERDGHAVWAAYTTREDMHRALTDWPRFGPLGQSVMALAGLLVLALPAAVREAGSHLRRQPALVVFVYGFLAAAAIAFARLVHTATGTDVPYAVVSWMPYRLTVHVALLILCVVSAWALGRAHEGRIWIAIVVLAWLALLPVWPHLLPDGLAQRYFANTETALFLLAGASLPVAWKQTRRSPALRYGWLVLVAAGFTLLAWYHQLAAAGVVAGLMLAIAVARCHPLRRLRRAPVAAAALLGMAVLAQIATAEFREREHLPISPFEARMREYLAANSAPDDMVLTPLDEHYQMVLQRPVVATFETRQFMSYMRSLAGPTDKLFADLYGVRDGQWYDWDLWMRRSEAEWRALGAAYGFRYVLSKNFHPLQLPARLQGEGLILYEIPDADSAAVHRP